MKSFIGVAMLALASAASAAGPISKFDNNPLVAEYDSSASFGDIERCLIDMTARGNALVYSQPDRPGAATIVWLLDVGMATDRIDLHAIDKGTHIRSWSKSKQAADCMPR